MALIEDQAFGGGRACDSPRNKTVPFEFARREDDDIASDPQTVKRTVHIHDQTAAFPMDREDNEKINIAAHVRRPARLGTEKDDSLRGEAPHESARNAALFFKVIEARYAKRSTLLTTNIDFKALGDYLGDPVITAAMVDRLVHHAIIISIEGPSYRMYESKKLNRQHRKKTAPTS